MNLVMGVKAMMNEDTFDTLKYGYIPLDHLMKYAKNKGIDLDYFEYDENAHFYRYFTHISLYYDGDFYDIDLRIVPPYTDYDDECYEYVTAQFYCGISNDEDLPYFGQNDVTIFEIKSREQFLEVLEYDWKEFVQLNMGKILSHRIEILNNINDIVKVHQNCNKNDYIKVMNIIANHIIDNIQNIIDFKHVKDWCRHE